jgi:hypothetical protein
MICMLRIVAFLKVVYTSSTKFAVPELYRHGKSVTQEEPVR